MPMYNNYYMNVRAYKKHVELDDEIIAAIKTSITAANAKPNARNKGYCFELIEKVDPYTIKIHLTAQVSVQPTRALASVTTSLVQDYPGIAEKLKVKKNVFKASEIQSESKIEDYSNIDQKEVLKTVIDIYMNNNKTAREYQDKIKDIIVSYKQETTSK